ncbi:MAG: thioredoxin domain-containing protein [Polyangiaceae bacterium]|nr:thioredoxin domain-containing protein [Polyangiaceae bacterium]
MIRSLVLGLTLTLATFLCVPRAAAQTRDCDGLKGAKRELASAILKTQHAYRCCDRTLDECLKRKPVCRVVKRLANDICRRVAAGQDRATIARGLARRATSMMRSGKRYPIALTNMPVAGDASAKVTAVLYLCPRCPFCSRMLPALYEAVTQGALKGKVKLYVRPYPLRSHRGSTEGSMAWMAAIKLGKFWPFALKLYSEFNSFDPAKLPEWAEATGMDRQEFRRLQGNAALRAALVESKKEGVRNEVDATPTLFINGRKYVGDLDTSLVADVLAEEYEAVAGTER